MKMPLSFGKLSSKLVPRWNEQGKRPRENTVQYEDVVSTFDTASGIESKSDEDGYAFPAPRPQRLSKLSQGLAALRRRSSNLSQLGLTQPILIKTPEETQREMVESIAARVLLLQRPDDELLEAELRSCIPMTPKLDQRELAFVGTRVPCISFVKYVERLVHNINRWGHERPGLDSVGIQCGVLAIEYLERLDRASINITPRSIHRYFLGAFLAGIKFNFDYYLSGTYWGGVGGIRVEELNFLEVSFCSLLNWSLYVSPEVYEEQLNKTRIF